VKTTKSGSDSTTKSLLLVIGAAGLSFLIMLIFLYSIEPGRHPASQEEVTTRGTDVSPFDPERVVSMFQMLGDGSLREVVVRDASDSRQIALIRGHLREKAQQYGRGDFSDAAKVHAEDMSWVNDLKAGAKQIDVQYADLPNGGQIRFTTANPVLVKTLHQWITAQVSDWERQNSVR
jgi:hypothetical protein